MSPVRGRCWPVLLALAATLALRLHSLGQALQSVDHTPRPPEWVTSISVQNETVDTIRSGSGGQLYLLYDTQIHVGRGETYQHILKEIVDATGAQNGANLAFGWNPTYQRLILHRIIIHRGNAVFNRLDLPRVKVIQQETDLDRQIYNGTLSALVFLDDVQPGDRIEYDYTVRGQNPALAGKRSETQQIGLPVPLQRRRLRLLWPEGRSLHMAVHGMRAEPERHDRDGLQEYLWDLQNLPTTVVEDQTPSWWAPVPLLEISEFGDWKEVAKWASGLFGADHRASPGVQSQVSVWQRPELSEAQKIDLALRFVQSQVRYLGLEFGPNSYQPTDPDLVLQRRFGDCKDKAFLLCTLLRAMDIDADPVLVSTSLRDHLADWLPSPGDFNHAIVRVRTAGKTNWLDATRAYQHGSFSERHQPAYGYGLVVAPGTTSLTPIPGPAGFPTISATIEDFKVGGIREPTRLAVTNTYVGSDAEWMRAALAASGADGMAKQFLNEYARLYPGLSSSRSLRILDPTNRDELTLTMGYLITNFWAPTSDGTRYSCTFYPRAIHNWITPPATTIRQLPMELSFPRRRSVRTHVLLPRPFQLSNATNVIQGPGAVLRVSRAHTGTQLWLNYDYVARTNFIPAVLTTEHLASLTRMEEALPYSLTLRDDKASPSTGQFNWVIALLGVIYAIGFTMITVLFCRWWIRRSERQIPPTPPLLNDPLNGFRGWLLWVGFGVFASPLLIGAAIVRTSGAFALSNWQILTNPGSPSYRPIWAPVLLAELLGQISMLVLTLTSLVLFKQRRRLFPNWHIGVSLLGIAFSVTDHVGVAVINVPTPQQNAVLVGLMFTRILGTTILVSYLIASRRVKSTFTR